MLIKTDNIWTHVTVRKHCKTELGAELQEELSVRQLSESPVTKEYKDVVPAAQTILKAHSAT